MARHLMLAVVVSLVLVSVAPQANGAAGTPITDCGQTVTTNAYLTQDLHCVAIDGVIVGADGITIDLKGFTLRGNVGGGSHYGINDLEYDGVTIQNGVVRNFDSGVYAVGSTDSVSLVNLTVSGNTGGGIIIVGDSASVKSTTASANSGVGINIIGATAKIQSSNAHANQSHGIWVTGASTKIQKSTASGNGQIGILADGSAPTLKGNRTEGNGFAAGASDLQGAGIVGSNNAVGKNIARGNDDPTECNPTFLC